jgi:lysophospholipid hydrolase
MLTGEANFYTCKAEVPSQVAILSREVFFEVVSETPQMVLSLAHNVLRRVSPLVREVDFALDWINIEGGKALYRQDRQTDGTFIVLSGRLRSVMATAAGSSKPKKRQIVAEYTHGEMIGLVEVITNQNRLTTVMAARDSELCKIPGTLLKLLKQKYPVVVSNMVSLLGNRLIGKAVRYCSEKLSIIFSDISSWIDYRYRLSIFWEPPIIFRFGNNLLIIFDIKRHPLNINCNRYIQTKL